VQQFEEEHFVRLDERRAKLEKKKRGKEKRGADFFQDLGDFGDFSALASLGVEVEQGEEGDGAPPSRDYEKRSKRTLEEMLAALPDSGGGAAVDLIPRPQKKAKLLPPEPEIQIDDGPADRFVRGEDGAGELEEDDFYQEMAAEIEEKKARKKAERALRKPDYPEEEEGEEEAGGKRSITYDMEKNMGVKKKRAAVRNPRVKAKLKYANAVKKHSSQVQRHRDQSRRYSGEATGIKTNVVKSRHL